jgi:hypothetical protein
MTHLMMKNRWLRRWLSDETYIRAQYQQCLQRPLDLTTPQTFNEKIQWLKLNYRRDILTRCTDKFAVREFVESRIGPATLKQLYGVYRRPGDIDPATLPDSFMLKTNHGCGHNLVCHKQAPLNWPSIRRKLNRFLRNNLFQHGREWAYKNIPPRILCEEYLDGRPLLDYNVFCFDGTPRFVEMIADRLGTPSVGMFDLDWQLTERKYEALPIDPRIPKPVFLEAMLENARQLAAGFPFVRVDFFHDGRKLYFGEMTFYPRNGVNRFIPDSFDAYLGSFLKLPARIVPG